MEVLPSCLLNKKPILHMEIYNLQQVQSSMDGVRVGSQYAINPANRRKKIEIVSTNKVESFKRQHYYESNPYSLNRNPSTPFLHRTQTTPETQSNRDNLTETSSQKSTKVVRANGLTKAEKPNLVQSRVATRPVVHRANGQRVGPAFSSANTEQYQQRSSLYQHYGMPEGVRQVQKHIPHEGVPGEDERRLRDQNLRLKQQLIKMEKTHNDEVTSLKQQMERILRVVSDLEEKIKIDEKEWRQFLQEVNSNRGR